jgi:hypothetical protein
LSTTARSPATVPRLARAFTRGRCRVLDDEAEAMWGCAKPQRRSCRSPARLGWILSAVAQFILQVNVVAGKALFPAATVLIGLGMLVAGGGSAACHSR